jgi:hypothetical protein
MVDKNIPTGLVPAARFIHILSVAQVFSVAPYGAHHYHPKHESRALSAKEVNGM